MKESKIMFKKIKKYFLKSLPAIVTSMVMLLSSVAHTQATDLDNSGDLSNYSRSIIARIKTKHANNPDLCNSEMSTLVETLLHTSSSSNQSTNVDKEIKKYKDRAPDVFEIEDEVIKETEPEVLLRTLIQLNKLFDKYKNFTQKLIKTIKSKKYSQKFTIKLCDSPKCDFSKEKWLATTDTTFSGINLSRKHYKKNSSCNLINRKPGNNWSPCDEDKYIEHIISHEFGHVMEFLYVEECWHMPYSIVGFIIEILNNSFPIIEETERDREITIRCNRYQNIKFLINYKMSFKSEDLGTYAQTGPREFFAEAFAALETSTDSKYKYIRNAVKDVISDWF